MTFATFRRYYLKYIVVLLSIGIFGNAIMFYFIFKKEESADKLIKKYTHFKDKNTYFIKTIQTINNNKTEYFRIDIEPNQKEDYKSANYKDFKTLGEISTDLQLFHIKQCNSCLIDVFKTENGKSNLYKLVDIVSNKYILIVPEI